MSRFRSRWSGEVVFIPEKVVLVGEEGVSPEASRRLGKDFDVRRLDEEAVEVLLGLEEPY